jgi:hypothetical protein
LNLNTRLATVCYREPPRTGRLPATDSRGGSSPIIDSVAEAGSPNVSIGEVAARIVERVRQISLNEIEERDSGDCANRHDGPRVDLGTGHLSGYLPCGSPASFPLDGPSDRFGAATDYAAAMPAMTPGVLRRELMAIDAVSPPRVDGYRTLSAQKIFALRYRLKMRRVDAFYHPAKVVKIQPNGNWADKSLIRQAMPQPWVPARSKRPCCQIQHGDK